MKWYADLSVGNNTVDEQHKKLFEVVENLIDACNQKKGNEEVGKTLKFLLDYTRNHFRDEEALMMKYGYPKIVDHKKEHDAFAKEVAEKVDAFNKGGAGVAVVLQVMNQANSWLINHIMKMDKEVGKHILSKA